MTDPIATIRAQIAAARAAIVANDAAALTAALSGVLAATTDVETVMSAANAQLVAQQKTIDDTNVALRTCQAAPTAANGKLAQVPKAADGTIAKPGTYSAPVLGAVAVAAGLLGAFGGYWYKGTTLKKSGAKAMEAGEEAAEPKRIRK